MTTEELANSLGVARQTVNRWIRQQGWKTEGINGVKGGRARLIHIDARVKEHIMNLPAIRNRQAVLPPGRSNDALWRSCVVESARADCRHA